MQFVLLAVSEEAETGLPSFCVQCIIKQFLDEVFVISRIIRKGYQPQPSALTDNPYLDLDFCGSQTHHPIKIIAFIQYYFY